MKTKDKVAQDLANGKTVGETAESLGVHRNTVSYHKQRLGDVASEAVQEYRAAQLIELSELKAQLVSPAITPAKKVELALAIIDREIDLLGTKAPTKSISATFSATSDPAYLDFKKSTAGLDDGQLAEVNRFAASLTRVPEPIDATWFPMPEKKEDE
jgi:hypothetical protein